MNRKNDDQLMSEFVITRDKEVFTTLVNRHFESALAVAQQYLKERSAAEDAVQEAFLKIIRNRNKFKRNQQITFVPWFYCILRNLCVDIIRKQKRHKEYVEYKSVFADLKNKQTAQFKSIYDNLLSRLNEKERYVLVLRFQHDMKFDEIAASLNCSEDAVKKRAQRGLNKLRHLYKNKRTMISSIYEV
jgi:RNA polymerase sigma-70 factor (ECF subfamily)